MHKVHLRFTILWFVAGFFEWPFFQALINPDGGLLQEKFWVSLGGHFFCLFLLFFAPPKGQGWFHYQRTWVRFSLFMVGFFPFLGWLGVGLVYFFYSQFFVKPIRLDDAAWVLTAPHGQDAFRQTMRKKARILHELDIMPLADILEGDDTELKRGAIEELARLRTPEAMDILLQHRSDHEMEVRFYVTSALSKVKKEFDEQLDSARQEMQKDVYKLDARIYLAKIYLDYARSNLLDEATSIAYEKEAIYHLEYVIREDGRNKTAHEWLITALIKHKHFDRAKKILESPENSGIIPPDKLQEYGIQIAFALGRFDHLLNLLRKDHGPGMQPSWQAQAHWWGAYD